ncbi:hypothetical protein lerEdw1_014373 [Lerista edwardsae]|nr:hypothetical protein lerEdw1_014373 [Lerista edwardsae]
MVNLRLPRPEPISGGGGAQERPESRARHLRSACPTAAAAAREGRFLPSSTASAGTSRAMPLRAPLLVLVVCLARTAMPAAQPGAEPSVRELRTLLASGEGSLPRGALESLLNIAAARVQCAAGPCGKEAASQPSPRYYRLNGGPQRPCLDPVEGASHFLSIPAHFGPSTPGGVLSPAWFWRMFWHLTMMQKVLQPSFRPRLPRQCQCIFAPDIFALTKQKSVGNANLTSAELLPFSAGLAFYFTDPTVACQAVADGHWVARVGAFWTGFSKETPGGEALPGRSAELMGSIQRNLKGNGGQETCAALVPFLENSTAISSQVAPDAPGRVLVAVAYHVLQGGCFRALPPEHYFLEYVFQRYGNETHNLTLAGLAKLMEQLKAGPESSHAGHDHAHHSHAHDGHHDHGHEGAAHDHGNHVDHHHGNETHHHDDEMDHHHGNETHHHDDEMDHHHGNDTHHHHDDDHHHGNQTEKVLVRQRRSLPGPEEPEVPHKVWDTVCLRPGDLLEIYGIDAGSGISHPDFTRLSPALIQQQLSRACSVQRTASVSGRLTTAEKYIYGSLATLVICLCALFGIVLLLCTACTSASQYVIQVFVSLAVGSLTGDAMLHLIPKFLGLHSHSQDEAHDHHSAAEDQNILWKLLAVLGGLYLFFLLEKFFILLGHSDYEEDLDSGKGHQCDHGMSLQLYQDEMKRRKQEKGASHADLVAAEEADFKQLRKEPSRELRMLPYMITIGDAIHNFADGLAIGAAFSASWKTGLATSLAVLCHELPHELGDFAALLHAGLSVKRALLLNFASALTAFVGLFIALSVATGEEFEAWIFTVATGLFLYVALCDMLPALMNAKDRRPWLLFGLQNLGLLAGWAILLLLSLFEENITL